MAKTKSKKEYQTAFWRLPLISQEQIADMYGGSEGPSLGCQGDDPMGYERRLCNMRDRLAVNSCTIRPDKTINPQEEHRSAGYFDDGQAHMVGGLEDPATSLCYHRYLTHEGAEPKSVIWVIHPNGGLIEMRW